MKEFTKAQQLLLFLIRKDFKINNANEIDININELDWTEMLEISVGNRLFPLVYQAIESYIDEKHKNIFKNKMDCLHQKTAYLLSEMESVQKRASEEKIRVVWAKGLLLAKQIYGDVFIRQSNDLDVLVEENDMIRLDNVVRGLGYIQPYSVSPADTYALLEYPLLNQAHYHHYFEYYKCRNNITSKIEIHRYIHFVRNEEIYNFLWKIQKIKINEIDYITFDFHHTLLALLEHAYQNTESLYHAQSNFTYLRDYVDIKFFIDKYLLLIDWDKLSMLSLKYGLNDRIYQVFKNLIDLYQNKEYEEILRFFISPVQESTKYMNNNSIQLNWKSNFLYRAMNRDERIDELKSIIKNRIFSKETVFKIYRDKNDALQIFSNKYNLDIKYGLKYDEKSFVFKIIIEKALFEELNKHMFELVLFNNNLRNKYLYSLINIMQDGLDYCARLYNTERQGNANGFRCNGIYEECNLKVSSLTNNAELIVTIPYLSLESNPFEDGTKYAYEFRFYKYMKPNIYYLISTTPTFYDSTIISME